MLRLRQNKHDDRQLQQKQNSFLAPSAISFTIKHTDVNGIIGSSL